MITKEQRIHNLESEINNLKTLLARKKIRRDDLNEEIVRLQKSIAAAKDDLMRSEADNGRD